MTQAEIAGGTVTPANELPSKGHRLSDCELSSVAGTSIRLSDYRGRSNLVLILADDGSRTTSLLSELVRTYDEIKSEECEILVIVRMSHDFVSQLARRLELPFPVLVDAEGRTHAQFGADREGETAVYVTDRYGEVFGVYRTRDGNALPSVTDILSWLEFVNNQCPECEPPEWPF
jgi:peroxiredoxin